MIFTSTISSYYIYIIGWCITFLLGIKLMISNPGKQPTQGVACMICPYPIDSLSMHCKYCNKCIVGLDHHCFYINNCIGKQNYRLYIVSMTCMTIMNIYVIVCCIMVLSETKVIIWSIVELIKSTIVTLYLIYLLLFHCMLCFRNMTTLQYTRSRKIQPTV